MTSALVIELFHNVSLVIDDIVDRSDTRRGRATLHTRFGELSALMTSGYIVADGYKQLGDDLQAIGLFSELLKRLGVAECLQWRLRRQPLGVEDWRRIAGEDTGSMFEVCAVSRRPLAATAPVRSPARRAVPRLRRRRRPARRRRARRRRRGGHPRRHPHAARGAGDPGSCDRCIILQTRP